MAGAPACILQAGPGRRRTTLSRDPAPRPLLASQRLPAAQALLADCRLCAHDCRVNRTAGQLGRCHADARARVFSAQLEVGEELELIPTFAIALSGCDLRCAFCITGQSCWNPRTGKALDAEALAAAAREALNHGARTVMLLGGEPGIHLPAVLEFVAQMPAGAKLAWKTNAHGSPQMRALLDGMFDVWVADLKFGNDRCAERLAGIARYTETVRQNLEWAAAHADLIVRHLLLPGHLDCCWRPLAEWLAAVLPGVKVSLRAGYWPAWNAARHPDLGRCVSSSEHARALDIAGDCRLRLVP